MQKAALAQVEAAGLPSAKPEEAPAPAFTTAPAPAPAPKAAPAFKPPPKAAPKDPFAGLSDSDDEAGGNGEASAFAKEKGNAAFGAGGTLKRRSTSLWRSTSTRPTTSCTEPLGRLAAMGDGTRAFRRGRVRQKGAKLGEGVPGAAPRTSCSDGTRTPSKRTTRGLRSSRATPDSKRASTISGSRSATARCRRRRRRRRRRRHRRPTGWRDRTAPAPPAPAPAPAAAAVPKDDRPAAVRWAEAAKRGDRPVLEALIAECAASAQRPADLLGLRARGIGHTALHWWRAPATRN